MSRELRLHRLAWRVRNLGFGERLVVWTQGCDLKCPGCCSLNSHDLNGGTAKEISSWMIMIKEMLKGEKPDGLTVSGGEPTLQTGAVSDLISAVRCLYPDIDVLLYSGLSWNCLQQDFSSLVKQCDVVVSEPYSADIPPISSLHGSGNQTIHLLTPLSKRLYFNCLNKDEMQPLTVTAVNGLNISAVGIPAQIQQLSEALNKRGIQLDKPSWRE